MLLIDIYDFIIPSIILSILIAFQIVIWRVWKPTKQMGILFMMFLGVPLILTLAIFFIRDLQSYFSAMVLLLSLCVVYVQSFPGFQAISPSLEMVNAVKSKSPQGATVADIEHAVLSDKLLDDRMNDLIKDGLAVAEPDGRLKLLPAGLFMAKLFYYYRKILGLPRGDG